jgi:hypothetical protein
MPALRIADYLGGTGIGKLGYEGLGLDCSLDLSDT